MNTRQHLRTSPIPPASARAAPVQGRGQKQPHRPACTDIQGVTWYLLWGCLCHTRRPCSNCTQFNFNSIFQQSDKQRGDGSARQIITTTRSSSKQQLNYATERVVGNGSFGVVFQATCLETGETVRRLGDLVVSTVEDLTPYQTCVMAVSTVVRSVSKH